LRPVARPAPALSTAPHTASAFPVAHPAAVLPLRRFAPRHLDFAARVIGALSPDFACALDQVNDFWRTVQWIGGTAAQDRRCVRERWDNFGWFTGIG